MSCGFTNRCMCLPVRDGLLIYGYFGLVSTYVTLLQKLFKLSDYNEGKNPYFPAEFIYLALIFSCLIIHFIFHIVLVAGLHRKSHGLLDVFYGYQLLVLIFEIIVTSLYLPLQIYKNYEIVIHNIWLIFAVGIPMIILILLQVYLLLKVRTYINILEDLQDGSYQLNVDALDQDCTLQSYNKTKDHCDQYELTNINETPSQ